jgi:hypothetical protein
MREWIQRGKPLYVATQFHFCVRAFKMKTNANDFHTATKTAAGHYRPSGHQKNETENHVKCLHKKMDISVE